MHVDYGNAMIMIMMHFFLFLITPNFKSKGNCISFHGSEGLGPLLCQAACGKVSLCFFASPVLLF